MPAAVNSTRHSPGSLFLEVQAKSRTPAVKLRELIYFCEGARHEIMSAPDAERARALAVQLCGAVMGRADSLLVSLSGEAPLTIFSEAA